MGRFHLLRSLLAGGALLVAAQGASAQQVVNVYTTREPGWPLPCSRPSPRPRASRWRDVFIKDGLAERVKAEGASSPADVLMTMDVGNLLDVVDAGVTQPVTSPALSAIPATCAIRRAIGMPSPCAPVSSMRRRTR